MQPDLKADYCNGVVDVVYGSDDPSEVYHWLRRLARTVNLLGFAKVGSDQVHIGAVLEGEAT